MQQAARLKESFSYLTLYALQLQAACHAIYIETPTCPDL